MRKVNCETKMRNVCAKFVVKCEMQNAKLLTNSMCTTIPVTYDFVHQ